MKWGVFKAIIIICVAGMPSFILAQEETGNSSLFFEQPYLLQRAGINQVHCILKDKQNIMWFATETGLYSFDGTNLKYFCHKIGDSTSLPSNTVLELAEDKSGKIWASLVTGIAAIDPATGRCIIYTGLNHRIDTSNFTNKICIDSSGNVWVGNNLGIFLFNKKQNRFINVWNNESHDEARGAYITYLISVNKHMLVATTFNDLVFFNKDNYSSTRLHVFKHIPLRDTIINSLFLDSYQKLWMGTWGGGVYTCNITTKKVSPVLELNALLAQPALLSIAFHETPFNKKNYLWISTSVGLVKCLISHDNVSVVTYYKHDDNTRYSILGGKLESLYFDQEGALWCAGEEGICRCFPFRNNFKPFAFPPDQVMDMQQLSLSNHTYYSICSWTPGNKIGFMLVDTTGRETTLPIKLHFTDNIDKNNFSGIAKDKYNRLWVASMSGMAILNNNLEVIKQWDKNTGGIDSLSFHRVNAIAIHNDTVWVACYNKGIDLYNLSFKKIAHYNATGNAGLRDNIIESFFTDTYGNFWLCGNGQLYRYSNKKFKAYSLSTELQGCNPREICEMKNGDLLISSLSGLIRFNPFTEKYTYIATDLLQKEQSVYSAAIDHNGGIWFLTNQHLAYYQTEQKYFILFGKEDGLDVSKGLSEIRTFNGRDFYICQNGQVIKYNSDSLRQPVTAPYLMVSFQVNDSIAGDGNSEEALQLPYDKNKLQFDFTGVTYIKADQNRYFYKLAEVDSTWSITYKNSVSYANLTPGDYHFRVKTQNYAGLWSTEKIIHFIIKPPYWNTWEFRVTITFIFLCMLFFVVRYISQRNLKMKILQLEKVAAVEKERNRIAQDMHDDLGSGLTKIAILSEVVKREVTQSKEASAYLESISDSSRSLVDSLQDIIWMLNSKHDQLESLVIYIREYATKYFEQSHILISFDYPPHIDPIKIADTQRRNLFLAIKEALNNIVKHANATDVHIRFSVQENKLYFVISDNGKGFLMEETRRFANGVRNMQNRMEQAGGSCVIVSEPGKGTTITFALSL